MGSTFVLVHGAWGGSYGFRTVRRPLREAGHEVYTPSLTGIGERAHLASPQVNLTTHITDVANAILYEDLTDIVLLGYSYGGMVVTGALAHVADRVAHLVYLDAFVPGDGDSLDVLAAGGPAGLGAAPGGSSAGADDVSAGLGASVGFSADPGALTWPGAPVGPGSEWARPPLERQFDDPAEAAWNAPRRVPHPAACFREPVRLLKPLEDYPFTRTYIKATDDPRPEPGGPPRPFWNAAVLERGRPRAGRPRVAVPRDRHQPHDPGQPPP